MLVNSDIKALGISLVAMVAIVTTWAFLTLT